MGLFSIHDADTESLVKDATLICHDESSPWMYFLSAPGQLGG